MDPFVNLPAASASALTLAVESRAGRKNPRKARSACNRCHSNKQRCVRKPEETTCERCVKLHVLCRFGPRVPRASRGPRETERAAALPTTSIYSNPESDGGWLFSPDIDASASRDNDIPAVTLHPDFYCPMPGDLGNMHSFWPGPFYEAGNTKSLDQYGPLDVGQIDQTALNMGLINQDHCRDAFPSPEMPNDHSRVENDHFITSSTCPIRNLANLNVSLYDCAANLPSHSMPETGGSKGKLFAIDELLRLTSDFIDAIKHLSHKSSSIEVLSTAHSQHLSPTDTGVIATATPNRTFSHIDEGTLLLLMSCYSRLTEIYVAIFHMMQACIEHSAAPQREKDWAIILPRLQVASHVTPPLQVDGNMSLSKATSSMYMVMITMLSSELCDQVADMMQAGDGDIRAGFTEIQSPSRCLFETTVTDRTDRLRSTIDATKQLLLPSSLVGG